MLAAGKPKGKKAFGKLPQQQELATKNSRDVAANAEEVLQQTVSRPAMRKGTGSTCPAALANLFCVA